MYNLSVDSVLRVEHWGLSDPSHQTEWGRHPCHDHPRRLYCRNLPPRSQHRSHLLLCQAKEKETQCVLFKSGFIKPEQILVNTQFVA